MERGIGARDPREVVKGCPSTMGDHYQLNTTTLIRHAARTHAEQEIVYRTPTGGWDRYTYSDCYARTCRTANAFRALGMGPGDRVGVLDWNSRRYFELYYAIPGLGAVVLQLNLRLGVEDLSYIIDHSHATFICVDESLPHRSDVSRSRLGSAAGGDVSRIAEVALSQTTQSCNAGQ